MHDIDNLQAGIGRQSPPAEPRSPQTWDTRPQLHVQLGLSV